MSTCTPNALIFADESQEELLTAGHVSNPAIVRGGMLRVLDRGGREEWHPIGHVRLAPATATEDRLRNSLQARVESHRCARGDATPSA